MEFWILLLRHFPLLLLMAPNGIHGLGKGNCSHLQDVTLKLTCNSVVPDYIFQLYRDFRAPVNTPYSVWQSDSSDIVLVSFHDNILHRFDAIRIDHYNPSDMLHTFSVRTSRGYKILNLRPSLLFCFSVGLRYPMELRSRCLGNGRTVEVATSPILHYAMDDLRVARKDASASLHNPCGILLIVTVFSIVFWRKSNSCLG